MTGKRSFQDSSRGSKRSKPGKEVTTYPIRSYFFSSQNSSADKSRSFSTEADLENDSESANCPDGRTDSENELLGPVNFQPETLQQRLNHVFPKFANGSFNDAPIAVLWEIARISLHCDVKLAELDLGAGRAAVWRDQASLRSALAQVKAFEGKELPPPSSAEAWNLALNGSQRPGQSLKLCGELFLNSNDDGPFFSLRLSALQLDRGHRLIRRFGADRFIEVQMPPLEKISDASKRKEMSTTVIKWLTGKKHYFLGRQWAAFYLKPGTKNKMSKEGLGHTQTQTVQKLKFYLFACGGDSFRKCLNGSLPPPEDAKNPDKRVKVSLAHMTDWAVGDLGTTDQQVPKLFSRVALSLTNTWPTVILEKHQIHNLDHDIGQDNPMNDGIGQISKSLASKIAQHLGLTDVPSAFQARFGSAKGLWIIHNNLQYGKGDWIVTYPSQRKWNCDFDDVHHRTFEVKDWCKEAKPASLNHQFITVLDAQARNQAHMRDTLSWHLRNCVKEDLDAQKDAMHHPVDLRLWLRQGGTVDLNKDREEVAFLGSLPRNDEAAIAMLVDAGFDPTKCEFLQERCRRLATARKDKLQTKMNIRVPCSTYLFMVVDFSGTLEENEVHVSFSTKFQVDGFSDTLLEDMDVLVTRAPAHLPWDMQKVRVVSRPELRHLKDCIAFSIKGNTSLADKLSGGDFDGDKAWVCWDKEIVQNFRNASVAPSGDDLSEYIHKLDLPMSRIRDQESGDKDAVCSQFLFEAFTYNMQDFLMGRCTSYKDQYCRLHGTITSPQIILLSKLLGMLVDQSKQGFTFTNDDWDRMRGKLGLPRFVSRKDGVPRREVPHILDFLQDVLHSTIEDAFTDFETSLKRHKVQQYDSDLTEMVNHFDQRYGSNGDWVQLRHRLRADIDAVSNLWGKLLNPSVPGNYAPAVETAYQAWQQIQPARTLQGSELVQSLLPAWRNGSQSSDWALLRASMAFQRCCQGLFSSQFIWSMAGRQLCLLKMLSNPNAAASDWVPVRLGIWSVLRPDTKTIKAQQARRAGLITAFASEAEEAEGDWSTGRH